MPLTKVTSGMRTLGTGEVATANMAVDPTNASNLSSGSVPSAQLGNAPETDLTPVRNDIATLALHSAIADNKAAYNLSNAFIDQFEDDTGIDSETDTDRISEYVSTVSGYGGNDASTVLLLHMDGSDDGTTFTDSSASPHTISRNGTVTKTGTKKFGTASAFFAGNTNNNYLSAPDSSDWDFGSGNFTMDCWINFNDVGITSDNARTTLMGQSYDGSNYTVLYWVPGDAAAEDEGLMFYAKDGSGNEQFKFAEGTISPYSIDTWYHVMVTRNGTAWKLWRDGSVIATRTGSETLYNWTYPFILGALGTTGFREFQGYMDEVRVSKGVDRTSDSSDPLYIASGSTYTPPTQVYDTKVANATGNFTSVTQTASSSVSEMGIVVLYKNESGTATLNTDISCELSANNGTNYSSATLVAGGTFSSGINIAAVSGVSVTAGTAPKYKISFANQVAGSKVTQVHGVALLY